METKHCNKCDQDKPLSEFYKSTRGGCKQCVREYQNKWYHAHKTLKREPVPEGMRRCNKCGEVKPIGEFYKDRSNVSGYHHYCKPCSDKSRRKRRQRKAAEKAANREPVPEGHKRCSKCGEILPFANFNHSSSSKDGYRWQCKDCEREYRQSPKAKASKKAYAQRPEVKARKNAKRRKQRRTDPETRAKEKAYRQEYQKRDYVAAANRERNAEYRSRPGNRKLARKRTIEWRKAHPKRCREQQRIKHLRKKNADGEHTTDQWEELLELCGGVCLYCGESEDITRDHIIPLAWGGSDRIDNIQPLCGSHNGTKKASYAADYRPRKVRHWAFREAQHEPS